MSLMRMLASGAGSPPVTAIEDVLFINTRTGTGASAVQTCPIDLQTKGGLIWTKGRSGATDHKQTDTIRGVTKGLITDTTAAQTTDTNGITAIGTTSYTVGSDSNYNTNGATYVDWCFAQAAKFLKLATVSHTNGTPDTVDLSSLGVVGMVTVKRYDASTSNWFNWHISNTAGKLCYLNTTDAETTDASISVSGTTLTIASSLATGTYLVEAWAHDTSANGLIQCGSFTTNAANASGTPDTIALGFEPQLMWMKNISGVENWQLIDTARGMAVQTGGGANVLTPNLSDAEAANYQVTSPKATGVSVAYLSSSKTYIYLAIRRGPMKLPTVGTQVYNAEAYTGNATARTLTGAGFPVDLSVIKKRGTGTAYWAWTDRLRGAKQELASNDTVAEAAYANDVTGLDVMAGLTLGTGASGQTNDNTKTFVVEYFRRYPGVFDVVCYTGDGAAEKVLTHNLTVKPKLILIKRRDSVQPWAAQCDEFSSPMDDYLVVNTTAAKVNNAGYWGSHVATSTSFYIGANNETNGNSGTFIAYLFATLAGISKVGSYTGNGSSLSINMGFSGNARFFWVKRTDSTGDWFLWDSVRGINGSSANDPHLSLNTTAAEVTTDNSVEPYTTGITVVENSTTHVNVNGASYIYLSFS